MIEERLVADLRSDPDLAGMLGTASAQSGRPARASIDWIVRPDSAALPGISLQVVGEDRLYAQGGDSSLIGKRVQADCWGATYAAARLAYRALKARMDLGERGVWRAFALGDSDSAVTDVPGGTQAFRVSGDFMIWYKED